MGDEFSKTAVMALGITAASIFYGRFIVQWIASEYHKKSVMPTLFWYMSAFGSVLLLTFGILDQSLLGTIGQNINVVIYGRNIAHIWRERGTLTPMTSAILHLTMFSIATIGLIFVVRFAFLEWAVQNDKDPVESKIGWAWLAVGLLGQALFALRFILQWIATEKQKRSVVPNIFWIISLVAALLQCAAFIQRAKWIFAIGMAITVFIYTRNIWFVYWGKETPANT